MQMLILDDNAIQRLPRPQAPLQPQQPDVSVSKRQQLYVHTEQRALSRYAVLHRVDLFLSVMPCHSNFQ